MNDSPSDHFLHDTGSGRTDKNLKIRRIPMKIYISQPIQGRSELVILRERTVAEQKIKRTYPDAEFSYHDLQFPTNAKHPCLSLIAESINLMEKADMIYFLDDIERDPITKVEYFCASTFNIPLRCFDVYEVSDKLNKALLIYRRNKNKVPGAIHMSKSVFELLKIECKPFLGELGEIMGYVTFEGIPICVDSYTGDTLFNLEG